MKRKVFLVDDHPLVREWLGNLINRQADLEVCGEAGSAPQARERIETARPDIVVVDIALENGSGLELIKDLRVLRPKMPDQYRATVLSALQNVADTLRALEQDGDALKAANDAEHAAKSTVDLTNHQLQTGYTNSLALLSAEQSYQQASINLVQAQANRYADTAALFQALGGGWWNR